MRQLTVLIFMLISYLAHANSTQRIPMLANDKVQVWKTLIYPNKEQILAMHRHEHNRVVVALDSGKLKVTNNKGEVHYLELEKDQAYYLHKDVPGELHTDENVSDHPIKVIVVELK
ncbi:MAG: hypothetical protein P4L79_00675 [Legionella sp.]|uniref:hypothetical protein n=1 Tax=Legionella sp. TaxID=459 RepID=UPI0028503D93|nr:hypothetical protein [Legionella sp.]